MKGRILILETSQETLAMLRQILTEAGHEVDSASDMAEALKRLGVARVDMLIAGTTVTGTSVVDLLREVKAGAAELPVLFVAEPNSGFQGAEAATRGAYGYIHNPIDGEQLRLLVLRAMEYGHLVRENRALRGDGGALAGRPLAEIEKQVILSTLERFKGHRLRTATALGIGLRTLGMKLKRWKEEGQLIESRG